VAFAVGAWSPETVSAETEAFAVIGEALADDGKLCLWSCWAGAGNRGAALTAALASATGAIVSAANGLVGNAAVGGRWRLDGSQEGLLIDPPLTQDGIAA